MNHLDFDALLKKGALPSVLLFEGEEEYLKQKALADLRAALLPAGMEELNETTLTGPVPDEIIASCETLPFLADRRLVIVREERSLSGRSEADEKLLDYLPKVPPSAVLLFFCREKPDGRKKLYAAVKKLNGIVTFSPLKDRELASFVTAAFRDQGKECDERTAEYLVFTSGSDLNQLLAEVAKISSHNLDSTSVSPDEVAALATPSLECTVFQMVDAVVARQSSRAFALLQNQLKQGADRMYILSMLLRQFRLLQHVKIMQFEKRTQEEIRSALGVPPFALNQYLRQASFYTGGQVKQAVKICFDTEYAVKSGKMNQDGALEAAILKILYLSENE